MTNTEGNSDPFDPIDLDNAYAGADATREEREGLHLKRRKSGPSRNRERQTAFEESGQGMLPGSRRMGLRFHGVTLAASDRALEVEETNFWEKFGGKEAAETFVLQGGAGRDFAVCGNPFRPDPDLEDPYFD